MDERREREHPRRESDVTSRVRFENLRIPVPLVFTILAICLTAIMTYGATISGVREESGKTNIRVAVLEANQVTMQARLGEMVEQQKETNRKLDELTRIMLERRR